MLSGEERVKHVEVIVHEAETIISNLKKQFDSFNGDTLYPTVVVANNSDRSLSNCVHTCMMAIEDIQEKLKVVELALNVTSSSSSDSDTYDHKVSKCITTAIQV